MYPKELNSHFIKEAVQSIYTWKSTQHVNPREMQPKLKLDPRMHKPARITKWG